MTDGHSLPQGDAEHIADALSSALVTAACGKKTKKVVKTSSLHTVEAINNENLPDTPAEIYEREDVHNASARQRVELSLRRVERMHKRLQHILEGYKERSPFSDKVFAYASNEIQKAFLAVNELSSLAEAVEKVGVRISVDAASIDKMQRMRNVVEKMVAEFAAVERLDETAEKKERLKLSLLKKYGIPKWVGKRKNGGVSAHEFLMQHYGHWIHANVFFKDDIRHIDKQLLVHLQSDVYKLKLADPLLPKSKRTDLLSTGVFGAEKKRKAEVNLHARNTLREKVRASTQDARPSL